MTGNPPVMSLIDSKAPVASDSYGPSIWATPRNQCRRNALTAAPYLAPPVPQHERSNRTAR